MMPSINTAQVALVIGASRGIGRQIAIDLAKEGYAGMQQQLSIQYSGGVKRSETSNSPGSGRRR